MLSLAALDTNIYTFGGQLNSSSSDRFKFSLNLNVLDDYRGLIVDMLIGKEGCHVFQAIWPKHNIYTHLVANLTHCLQIILLFLLI